VLQRSERDDQLNYIVAIRETKVLFGILREIRASIGVGIGVAIYVRVYFDEV